MMTRYTPLVSVKKNIMQKSERVVQTASLAVKNAQYSLDTSLQELQNIETPSHGKISQFLSTRTLLDSQRSLIRHNEEWLEYAQKDLLNAKEQLKKAMIEFEKFKYLEFKEIEKELQKIKLQESKELDEIALMAHTRKDKTRVA